MTLPLPIAAWSAWAPGLESQAAWLQGRQPDPTSDVIPEVKFIDAMTRRRLGRLARMTLQVAHDVVGEQEKTKGTQSASMRMVYASRHGDLHQTLTLLTALARQEPLSPTAFGLSVHNAIPGIWSLLRKDHAAVTAVSAGAQTLYAGLLEAALQAQEVPGQSVLYVYADDRITSPYCQQMAPIIPQALAIRLHYSEQSGTIFPPAAAKSEVFSDVFSFVRNLLVENFS